MLQAIAVGKKKNDQVDARKIADLLRCDYFPEWHMAPREIRDSRRVLRCRNLLVRQAVQMKNKVSENALRKDSFHGKHYRLRRLTFSRMSCACGAVKCRLLSVISFSSSRLHCARMMPLGECLLGPSNRCPISCTMAQPRIGPVATPSEANCLAGLPSRVDCHSTGRDSAEQDERQYSAGVKQHRRDYTKVHCPALAIYAQSTLDVSHGDSARIAEAKTWEEK